MRSRANPEATFTLFEGPDGCGKSTLIQRLLDAGEVPAARHFDAAPGVGVELIHQYLDPLLAATAGHLVYDRGWLSEAIYGEVARGADRLGLTGRRYLERVALSLRGVVLMPAATLQQCAERYAARRSLEYLDSEEKLRAVYDRYALLGARTALPALIVDGDLSAARLMEEVEAHRPGKNLGPGLGAFDPERVTLLVGEKSSDPAAEGLPFISIDNKADGCAFWLTWKLEEWGVSERSLYWINALDDRGRETSPAFLAALRPRRVVALGRTAARWCASTARVTHAAVDHPQYWKRFRHFDPYPLKEALS